MVWDITCVDTLANSHKALASSETGAVVGDAKNRKKSHLDSTHTSISMVIALCAYVFCFVLFRVTRFNFLLQCIFVFQHRRNLAQICYSLVCGSFSLRLAVTSIFILYLIFLLM